MKFYIEFILIVIGIIIGIILIGTLVWSLIYVGLHREGNRYTLRIKKHEENDTTYETKEGGNYFSLVWYFFISKLRGLGPAIIDVITTLFMQV